ncbi:MAG TPA: ATP-binding protein [Candidatus Acidoferrales bacterium]|nr:ATP-binding protein [Candidatus Acidoferrales bacterium]
MSIQAVRVNEPEQVRKIIWTKEDQFADIKAIEAKPSKLTEDISAFANADGGELYIGIDQDKSGPQEKRTWRGFADQEAANGFLQCFVNYFPLGSEFQYEFIASDFPGLLLHVIVNKTIGVTLASNNIPYLRRGAESLPQNTTDLRKRLEYSKGVHSFEGDLTNAGKLLVTESEVIKEFIRDVVPSAQPEEYLRKQSLIKEEKVTVAAALLFADEPQAILPKHCGIKVYRYKTTSTQGFRDAEAFIPKTVEGCLYKQIHAAVNLTKEVVDAIPTMGSEKDFGKVEYPQRTLHEFIANAVIHRDYNLKDDIHIRIFDNRIEFQSPGRLPANMTVRNLTTQRAARNGAIQRILNKFIPPANRDIGEGIKTATEAMTKKGLEKPSFAEDGNSFVVTIKHEKRATAELAIMEYLESHETVNNKQAREITFIHEDWKVKSIFRRMEKNKMIKQVEGTVTSQIKYRKWRKEDELQGQLQLKPSE